MDEDIYEIHSDHLNDQIHTSEKSQYHSGQKFLSSSHLVLILELDAF